MTEQWLAAAEIERTAAMVQSILDGASDAIFIVDAGTRMLKANRRCAELPGVAPELLETQRPVDELFHALSRALSDGQSLLARVAAVRDAPETDSSDVFHGGDGAPLRCQSRPLRTHGRVVGRAWIFSR
jgi:PAS domain-containing protein